MTSHFMTAPQELRTARLLLRSFEREDVPAIVRLAGANEIAATTLHIPHPYAEDDARNFLAKAGEDFLAGRSVSFAITILPGARTLRRGGTPHCGRAQARGTRLLDRCAVLGQRIRHGGCTAAVAFGFETLGLHRIYAHHFAGNMASQRVLEKIGMRHEGRSRQHIQKWERVHRY